MDKNYEEQSKFIEKSIEHLNQVSKMQLLVLKNLDGLDKIVKFVIQIIILGEFPIKSKRTTIKKVLVIGSGFGGIASALRLKALKYDVTILEKLDQIGGRARVFKKVWPYI